MSTEVGKIEVGDEYDFRGTVVHLYDDGWAGRASLAPTIPGSRASGWKRKVNGTWERRT